MWVSKRVWIIGGIVLTGENWISRKETCTSANSTFIIFAWTDLRLKFIFRSDRRMIGGWSRKNWCGIICYIVHLAGEIMSGTKNRSRPRFEPMTTRMWVSNAYGSQVGCSLESVSNTGHDWCYFNITDFVLIINQPNALISQMYFGNETLHVSDSSSSHHQEFFTVHTKMVYVIQVLLCTVKNSWWCTDELSETCRVLFQKYIWQIGAPSWFYCKKVSRWTVTWTSKRVFSFHLMGIILCL